MAYQSYADQPNPESVSEQFIFSWGVLRCNMWFCTVLLCECVPMADGVRIRQEVGTMERSRNYMGPKWTDSCHAYGNDPFLLHVAFQLGLQRVKAEVLFTQFLLHHGRCKPHYKSLLVVEYQRVREPDAVFKGVVRDFGHRTSFPSEPVCYLSLETV